MAISYTLPDGTPYDRMAAAGGAPAGGDVFGQPSGMPAWLARIMGYVNPIGSANAAAAPPQDPRSAAISQARGLLNSGQAGNTNNPEFLPYLDARPNNPNVQGRPILPYLDPNTAALASASTIPTSGASPAAPPPGVAAPPAAPPDFALPRQGPGYPALGMPTMFPPQGMGYPALGTPGSAAFPGGGPGPTPTPFESGFPAGTPSATPRPARTRIPATARAQVPAARSPFAQIDRPNADAAGGGRRGGGPLQMSALDLSGLFNRAR